MKCRFRILLFPILGCLLVLPIAVAAPAARHRRDLTNWDKLAQLAPRTEIKVVLTSNKSYLGKFQNWSDAVIVVQLRHGEQAFSRQDVLRVSIKDKSHRLRNTLVGLAIGTGAGIAFGELGTYEGWFNFVPADLNDAIFIPSLAIVGTIVGAALPTGRWLDVYRSP